MNRPWKLVVPAACVALGLAGPVPADQFSMGRVGDYLAEKPVNESVSLSLQQALEKALRRNSALQSARAGVGRFEGRLTHASRWLPANPELSLQVAERDQDGQSSTDKGIRLSQEIWIGGQRGLGKAAASARLTAAEQRLAFLETSVRARVRLAYLEALLARESVETAERAETLTGKLYQFASQRFQAGAATQLILNTARIGAARARAALVDARRDHKRARLALMELLDPESARLRLTSELSLDRFNLPSMGPLLGEALKRRQDLVAAAREVVAARKTLSLSKRQLIPNLKVFGFMKEEEGADVAGLGVSMPIPVWDTRSGENQVARAELEQARIEEDALRLQVRTEVIGAVTDYNAARQRLEVFGEDVLASAEENVRLTEKAFRAGSVGAPTLAMAQDDLINTRREYLDALREAIGAAAALERSTGGVVALREAGTEQLKNTGDSES
jgi:cobalt-zinc-cadmium efflux system outer membrane protein